MEEAIGQRNYESSEDVDEQPQVTYKVTDPKVRKQWEPKDVNVSVQQSTYIPTAAEITKQQLTKMVP